MPEILLLLLLLSACTVGDDYQKPKIYDDEAIKKELNLSQQYKLPEKWYEELGDEQLNSLIEQGLQNSPDIEIAISRLKQSRAQLAVDKTNALPFINLSGGWNYEKASRNIEYGTDSHYYNAGFDASWELDLWGKNRRLIEADEAEIQAQEYTLKDVRITLAAEIASDYAYLFENRELLRTARENETLQQKIFSNVKAKYDSGLADDITYNQAQYLLAQTKAAIPAYESNIENYQNALAVLIGKLPSEIKTDNASPLFKQNYGTNKKLVYGIPAASVRLRPDVAAAERKLAAQNAIVGTAVAALYPDVSISGFWGYASKGGHGLISSESQTYNYNPALSLPLLDWNKLNNNIELQKQIYAENLAQYKKALLNAVREIKNAGISWENSGKTLVQQRVSEAKMRQAVNSMQKRYDKGLINFSDLLTMRQNLIQAQNLVIKAKGDEIRQLIAFYKAAGI